MAESLPVGRNFMSDICKLKPKKPKNLFFVKYLGFTGPGPSRRLSMQQQDVLPDDVSFDRSLIQNTVVHTYITAGRQAKGTHESCCQIYDFRSAGLFIYRLRA